MQFGRELGSKISKDCAIEEEFNSPKVHVRIELTADENLD